MRARKCGYDGWISNTHGMVVQKYGMVVQKYGMIVQKYRMAVQKYGMDVQKYGMVVQKSALSLNFENREADTKKTLRCVLLKWVLKRDFLWNSFTVVINGGFVMDGAKRANITFL